mmetsp:Transcript_12876/g.27952  ORF Transcript_12876/g.27952 Transcript_12876/m.27952 type:complete len:230 (+) Transcript_12876:1120-1809(+)
MVVIFWRGLCLPGSKACLDSIHDGDKFFNFIIVSSTSHLWIHNINNQNWSGIELFLLLLLRRLLKGGGVCLHSLKVHFLCGGSSLDSVNDCNKSFIAILWHKVEKRGWSGIYFLLLQLIRICSGGNFLPLARLLVMIGNCSSSYTFLPFQLQLLPVKSIRIQRFSAIIIIAIPIVVCMLIIGSQALALLLLDTTAAVAFQFIHRFEKRSCPLLLPLFFLGSLHRHTQQV